MVRRAKGAVQVLLKAPATPPATSWGIVPICDTGCCCCRRGREGWWCTNFLADVPPSTTPPCADIPTLASIYRIFPQKKFRGETKLLIQGAWELKKSNALNFLFWFLCRVVVINPRENLTRKWSEFAEYYFTYFSCFVGVIENWSKPFPPRKDANFAEKRISGIWCDSRCRYKSPNYTCGPRIKALDL